MSKLSPLMESRGTGSCTVASRKAKLRPSEPQAQRPSFPGQCSGTPQEEEASLPEGSSLDSLSPHSLKPPTRLTPQTLRPEPALPGAAHPGQRPLPSLSLLAAVVPCPVTTATPLDAALTGSVCPESAPSALGDLLRPRAMAMTRPCPAAHGFPDLKPSLAWSCPDRQIGL
ncbi:hypothetical protein CapIbe_012459 [Capra ibex]